MKLALLCIATLAIMVSVEACGGKKRPPPVCHFTTCSVRYTGWDNGANISPGKCGIQYNRAQIITQNHQRNGGCPANQQCHGNHHSRRMCKCEWYFLFLFWNNNNYSHINIPNRFFRKKRLVYCTTVTWVP